MVPDTLPSSLKGITLHKIRLLRADIEARLADGTASEEDRAMLERMDAERQRRVENFRRCEAGRMKG